MKGVSVGKRTGSLLLAVVLATLATVALITYVHGVEKRALAGVETVEVYVARDAIPAGMSADDAVSRSLITKTAIPRKVVAEGAVASLDSIRGRVAAVTILKGEQIVSSRFVARGEVGDTLAIPESRQAISVEVDYPPGVAGFVTPGSRVSVIAHLDLPVRGDVGTKVARTQYLLQNVQVLAVGRKVVTTTDSGDRDAARRESGSVDSKVLLTLAVTHVEAEKLVHAIYEGNVYFTLLPPNQKPARTAGRTPSTLFR